MAPRVLCDIIEVAEPEWVGAAEALLGRDREAVFVDRADISAATAMFKEELQDPGRGKLDAYLKPFIRKGSQTSDIAGAIKAAPGLDGSEADTVAGDTTDPKVKAQYEAQEDKRKSGKNAALKDK
ncbi:hypothetical protein [Bradyrhizobium uaiense]|uniref:hypothetical protein n=1 Tax=Bradyrhizobium uaiense TaxID=2594946 RepID=UPI001F16E14D|nr:hypothetical protein [Bradyrhizobium uaiense]